MFAAIVDTMSAAAQAICFVLAVAILLVAALVGSVPKLRLEQLDLVALGIALFVFVYAWNALAAA